MFCDEIFEKNIVSVDLYADYQIPIPMNLSGVVQLPMQEIDFGERLVHISMTDETLDDGAAFGLCDDNPTVKVKSSINDSSRIYTHDLSVSITDGIEEVQRVLNAHNGVRLLPVYTLCNGDKKMSLSLSNAFSLTMDEQLGKTQNLSISLSCQSMNPTIVLE